MDPDHHRQPLAGTLCRSPYVDEETVLRRCGQVCDGGIGLHARATELLGGADAFPLRRRLRRSPAEIPDRRRGVRDAAEDREPVFNGALQRAAIDSDRPADLRQSRIPTQQQRGTYRCDRHRYAKATQYHGISFSATARSSQRCRPRSRPRHTLAAAAMTTPRRSACQTTHHQGCSPSEPFHWSGLPSSLP